MASEMNYQNVQVENDCRIAVTEILKKQGFYCERAGIFMDILYISLEFESCSFRHISQNANELAHNLAKLHSESDDRKIWTKALPLSLCNYELLTT